ncbi:MAG: ABC transporter permease [Rectinema sp.]|nr:ABC transporter permease [Rectinema sp.]
MIDSEYHSREAQNPWRAPREILRARGLLLDLVRKDLRVRYRYAALGFLWAFLEPLALMTVLTLVFQVLMPARLGMGGDSARHFALEILCGLLFWQYTAESLRGATVAVVENPNLVQKVRFPREILPLAALGYPLFNLCVGLLILLALQVLLLKSFPGMNLLYVFPLIAMHTALLAGAGLLLSAAHTRFRDVGYIVGVTLLFGFYASPVFYDLSLITANVALPQWAKFLYSLNPMAGIISFARGALLRNEINLSLLLWPIALSCLLFPAGLMLFRRKSPLFSDYL